MELKIDNVYNEINNISNNIKEYVEKQDKKFLPLFNSPALAITYYDGVVKEQEVYALAIFDDILCAYMPPMSAPYTEDADEILKSEYWHTLRKGNLIYYAETIINIGKKLNRLYKIN